MTDERPTASAPGASCTERRGSVLLITLNRPEVRNAVNAALAAGVAGALDELDADDALSVGVLTGAGGFFCAGMDLGAFVEASPPGSATAASPASPSAPPQAADRGDRGLRRRGRHGDRAVLRSDRRRPRCPHGHTRGQALARRRRRRAAADAATHALPRGHGAGADRRPAARRALPRARPGQPPDRARRRGRGRARAGRGARQERSARADRHQADPAAAVRLDQRRDVGSTGRDHRPGVRLRGRQGGLEGVQGEARAGLEGALSSMLAASAPLARRRGRLA